MTSRMNGFVLGSVLLVLFGTLALFAAQVIQTQESDSWEGMEADLVKVSDSNDILTLRFKFRNTAGSDHNVSFMYKDCYIVDETNQKKYFALKDSEGQFIGGPKDKDWEGGRFGMRINPGESKGCWMKFPVPADHPESISITIPGFFPFEDVKPD